MVNRESGKEADPSDSGTFREIFVQGFGPDYYRNQSEDNTIGVGDQLDGEDADGKANIIINNDDDYYSD